MTNWYLTSEFQSYQSAQIEYKKWIDTELVHWDCYKALKDDEKDWVLVETTNWFKFITQMLDFYAKQELAYNSASMLQRTQHALLCDFTNKEDRLLLECQTNSTVQSLLEQPNAAKLKYLGSAFMYDYLKKKGMAEAAKKFKADCKCKLMLIVLVMTKCMFDKNEFELVLCHISEEQSFTDLK